MRELIKKMKNSGGKKIIVVAAILMVILVGLMLNLVSVIQGVFYKVDYPESSIYAQVRKRPVYEGNVLLTEYKQCPTLGYVIAVPAGMTASGEALLAKADGVTYLVMESAAVLSELMEGELPMKINFPVLGSMPQYKEVEVSSGFFYDMPAQYCAGVVDTKVSIRKVTEYVVAYSISFRNNMNLVLYASTQDREKLEQAEEVLRSIALSAREVPKVSEKEETEDETTKDTETKEDGDVLVDGTDSIEGEDETKLFPIYEEVENKYVLSNGICWIKWVNLGTVPESMYIDKGDGELIEPSETYSLDGEYVFLLGACKPGKYIIKGETPGQFEDVRITFMELEKYQAMLAEESNPTLVVPRY